MQAYAGIAPIKLQSGGSSATYMRRFSPKFIRQSFHEWAGTSIQYSPWAKAYYKMQIGRGKSPATAKRSLAFKWMRVVYKLWQTNTAYDEKKHVDHLVASGSPTVKMMQELEFLELEKN